MTLLDNFFSLMSFSTSNNQSFIQVFPGLHTKIYLNETFNFLLLFFCVLSEELEKTLESLF